MFTFISPAKINLFLQVLGKRNDGYHNIASLFQAIKLHDTLQFTFSKKDEFTCSDSTIPLDHSNLVMKALHLFRQKTQINKPLTIFLEKHIPKEAGLGGGSSNAATTLFALNELFQSPLSLEELKNLASNIGSDVPFFFSEGTAYCTGRGEIVTELKPLPTKEIWIVKPKEGLKTPLIFQEFKPLDMSHKNPNSVLKDFLRDKPTYFNDLESSAFRTLPKLLKIKKELINQGFSIVLMSGTGSSFFCEGKGKIDSTDDFEIVFKTQYLNRKKNNWYKTEKDLQ